MATYIAEFFGFLVMLFVLYRYVWPMLKKMLDERQEQIARQEQEAAEAEKALTEARSKYESAVAEAEQEASRIRDDARADSTKIREELREQAEHEAERIRQRGQEALAAQREQYVRQLRAETAGQSMQLAERMIDELLTDEGQKRATVDGFLEELDGLDGRSASARQPAQAGGGVS